MSKSLLPMTSPKIISNRSRLKDAAFFRRALPFFRRALPFFLLIIAAVLFLVFLLREIPSYYYDQATEEDQTQTETQTQTPIVLDPNFTPKLPKQTNLSISLAQRNLLPPRNLELLPNLPKDHITIVLYVHNRPQYLQTVVRSLSNVLGIEETLLIVSHDGFFPEMDNIVQGIKFCQVKQIFAPYSPYLYPSSFPGFSPDDCRDRDVVAEKKCVGNADQFGNHRSPRIVSLKHHWWWMMNTVWDGLNEMKRHAGHVLFIEEDHFIYPNAYRNIQMLTKLKPVKCPDCIAANLAPSDVNARGEGWESLVAEEKIGNVGYTFNRTVWRKIHAKAKEFCSFDDYNWDITMWATVYPSFGSNVYSLRGPRRSAAHFGKCGLHQGKDKNKDCVASGGVGIEVEEMDKVPNIRANWPVHVVRRQDNYKAGFGGWGGWSDKRDHELCVNFAYMYHLGEASSG